MGGKIHFHGDKTRITNTRCNSFNQQVLESAGILKNIKRVAGASAGAIIATLIALGYDSQDLREFLEQDLRRILVGEFTLICIAIQNFKTCPLLVSLKAKIK